MILMTSSENSELQPQPGTYAFTARLLAGAGFMSGDEADEWKDRMKDEVLGDK